MENHTKFYLLFILLMVCSIGVNSSDASAAIKYKKIVGKYSFDSDLYYKENGTGAAYDFGSEFNAFKPYLKITKKKRITYYFSFEGGKGICRLRKNTLRTVINNPNRGKVKEKMKVKKIKGYIYIIQEMDGKKIFWKKVG